MMDTTKVYFKKHLFEAGKGEPLTKFEKLPIESIVCYYGGITEERLTS